MNLALASPQHGMWGDAHRHRHHAAQSAPSRRSDSGALHRRLDAVYDGFETDFSAHEEQTHYFEIVQGLVEAAESGGAVALKMAASFGLGVAGGIASAYVVPAMPLANKAATWVGEQDNLAPLHLRGDL